MLRGYEGTLPAIGAVLECHPEANHSANRDIGSDGSAAIEVYELTADVEFERRVGGFVGITGRAIIPSGNITNWSGARPSLRSGRKLQNREFVWPDNRIRRNRCVIVIEGGNDARANDHIHSISDNESKRLIAGMTS
jgi:hypothetical protein